MAVEISAECSSLHGLINLSLHVPLYGCDNLTGASPLFVSEPKVVYDGHCFSGVGACTCLDANSASSPDRLI